MLNTNNKHQLNIKKMETKVNFKTHNETNVLLGGTSLMGYMPANTTYMDLLDVFGEPMEGDGYKVDAEWQILFDDGTVATIYNYKNGKNYCGDDGLDVCDMVGDDWHIGGVNGRCVSLLLSMFAK